MFVRKKILGRKKTVQKEIFQFLLDASSIPLNKMILIRLSIQDILKQIQSRIRLEDLEVHPRSFKVKQGIS